VAKGGVAAVEVNEDNGNRLEQGRKKSSGEELLCLGWEGFGVCCFEGRSDPPPGSPLGLRAVRQENCRIGSSFHSGPWKTGYTAEHCVSNVTILDCVGFLGAGRKELTEGLAAATTAAVVWGVQGSIGRQSFSPTLTILDLNVMLSSFL